MIATAMSANVFFWIIPGQRKVVAAMTSGEKVDPKALAIHGKRGKQRSVHNTYFTLPVIFAMLSNHYGFLYTNKYNWAVLILMMLAGALIRQFFVQRHGWHHGRAANPWPFAAVGVVLILAVIEHVLEQRCYMCHGAQVQMKNVRLDTPEGVKTNAQMVYQQVVVLKQMPMNNATGLTEAERALIAEWFKAGAKTQ
jgi:uncharacterized membrane protein